jgi:hypothetical protein
MRDAFLSVASILLFHGSTVHCAAQVLTPPPDNSVNAALEAQKQENQQSQAALDRIHEQADLYVRLKFVRDLSAKSTPCALSALDEAATRASIAAQVWRDGFEQIRPALAEKMNLGLLTTVGGGMQVLKGAGGVARAVLQTLPAAHGISKFLDRAQATATFSRDIIQDGQPTASSALGAVGVATGLGSDKLANANTAAKLAKGAVDYSNAASQNNFLGETAAALAVADAAGVPGAKPASTAVGGAADIVNGGTNANQGVEIMQEANREARYYYTLCMQNADKRQVKADLLSAIAQDMRSGSDASVASRLASVAAGIPDLTRTVLDQQVAQALAEASRCVEAALDQAYPNRDRSKGWNGCDPSQNFDKEVDDLLDDALAEVDRKGKEMNDRIAKQAKSGAAAIAAAAQANDIARQQAKAQEEALTNKLLTDLMATMGAMAGQATPAKDQGWTRIRTTYRINGQVAQVEEATYANGDVAGYKADIQARNPQYQISFEEVSINHELPK